MEDRLFPYAGAPFLNDIVYLAEDKVMRHQEKRDVPFNFNANITSAQSDPGGKTPTPSLYPGRWPSDSRVSEIPSFLVFLPRRFGAGTEAEITDGERRAGVSGPALP